MNVFCINNYIIKNSMGEILRFYLDKNNRINYDLYDINHTLIDQYLVSESITNSFSLDIDNKDRIHLIYLTNEGNVCYSLYSNKRWAKKTLTQFDMRSNYYSNLILRVNKESIHILFSFSNLVNPKVWTIQHLIGTKGNWEKTSVISFTSSKTIPSFSLDFDKFDNIHIIYTSTVEGIQRIYYTFLNSSSKKWSQVPKLLSEPQNSSIYPNLLVDRKDNIHVLWLTQKNNGSEVKYKHLSQLGSSKNTWKEETTPLLVSEYTSTIIFEDKDFLKIFLKEKNKVYSLVSFDYGFSWNFCDDFLAPLEVNIDTAIYLTNFPVEKNSQKLSHVFFYLDNMKILFKNDLVDYLKKYSSLKEENNNNIDNETEMRINTINTVDDKDFLSVNKEKVVEQTNSCFYNSNEIKLILHKLSDLSNDIINSRSIATDFISQFKNIDDTLLALKESIDINNQCFIDIDRKIDEFNNKNSKKGFWSRFFNRV